MQASSILGIREEKPRLIVNQCDCLLAPPPRHTVDLEAHIDRIAGLPELELRIYAQDDFLEVNDVHYSFVPDFLSFEIA